MARYVSNSEVRLVYYSIQFDLCGSPPFYHLNQNQRKRVRLFTTTLPAGKKNALFHIKQCNF